MPNRTAHLLISALVTSAIIGTPVVSEAGGMPQMETYGGGMGGGMGHVPPPSTCPPVGGHPGRPSGGTNIHIYKPTTIENNIHVYKPVTINKSIDVTNNIDNSKTINVTKNIDNSKTIDNSKNININKSIVINKGGDNISVSAEASASASAAANAASFAGAGAIVMGGGWAPEAPTAFAGGDIGTLNVETAPVRAQCTIQQATIVKTIHAVCVSSEGHEFPASHMLGDTWINGGYEGEVVRCIPGSHLKIMIGKVVQSSEGLAAGTSSGQVLECGAHEALRHYKDGLVKCAPAVPVVDCTERTNLRKYGTSDLFFSYRAEVCLETQEEYSAFSAVDKPWKGMQSRAR
ncbi:MAG: hypothetical protein J0I19_11830 [Alphaproteobacteria bacterium]|nr:hypothetical protein [Alphaproteobacteria bacterium]